jgi:hypothetical protein
MPSTVEQQYTNSRGKDGGVLLYNTNNNSMTRTPPAELNGQIVQPATEAFPAKSNQKSLRYHFSKYKDKENWIAGMAKNIQ